MYKVTQPLSDIFQKEWGSESRTEAEGNEVEDNVHDGQATE